MKHEPVKDRAERKRILALIERCEKEQTMAISEMKMQMVIANYFKSECDTNTSIRQAFEKGFRIGAEKGASMNRVQEWIPCSERLPKEAGFYLVTITDGEQIAVCKMPFVESEWRVHWDDDEVIAWMPLPKPYCNSSEKPNNCGSQTERMKTLDYCDICNHKGCGNCIANQLDDYCVPSGYEPITKTKTQNSNLTFEKRTMRDCYNCKRYETEDECIECHYEPKDEPTGYNLSPVEDEPQTDCGWK